MKTEVKKQPQYLSYLLRLWQTSDGRKQIWRASLQSPGAGERHGFADLKDMFNFLQTQTSQTVPQDEQDRAYDYDKDKPGEE